MPYSFVQTVTATGAQVPCIVDNSQSPFSLSAAVGLIGAGTATFSVEFTFDDVNDPSITPIWFPDPNLAPDKSANGFTSIVMPIQAIRINVSAISGSLRFTVLQGIQQP